MSYIAVIPARGGSKGVKNKNLQLVGGMTLVARAIIAANNISKISRVIVSTDSASIEEEALKYGAEVHRRREATSSDIAKTIDVLKDICDDKDLKDDICILLQPTSPLRQSEHIQSCIDKYEALGFEGSIVTGTVCEHHPYKTVVYNTSGDYEPIRKVEDLETPRQQLPKALRINGAIYIISFKLLLEKGSFFAPPTYFIEMNEVDSIDIDTYEDLTKANLLVKGNKV